MYKQKTFINTQTLKKMATHLCNETCLKMRIIQNYAHNKISASNMATLGTHMQTNKHIRIKK
jgi:hypothetical protein